MKYSFAQIICALYPGAEFSTHEDPDETTLKRVEQGPHLWLKDNLVLEWLDTKIEVPEIEDIVSRIEEAEALIEKE